MIMRSGQQLLLPANPVFIWSSLIAALLLNMLPLGRVPWMPDFLALVLVFWNVHQPLRVGIGVAFMFGLAMDVHQTSLLGQHALSYTALSFLAAMIHRRLLWFTVPSQAVQVTLRFRDWRGKTHDRAAIHDRNAGEDGSRQEHGRVPLRDHRCG